MSRVTLGGVRAGLWRATRRLGTQIHGRLHLQLVIACVSPQPEIALWARGRR